MNPHRAKLDSMKVFELHRNKVVDGHVTTYAVAEGVEWGDGTVAMRWLGENPSSVTHNSIEAVKRVHVHPSGLTGGTSIVWVFEPA